MTEVQIRSLRRIYIWALVLLAIGVAMTAIGKVLLMNMYGGSGDWSQFPFSFVQPEIAYFFGLCAATYLTVMLIRSKKLLTLQGARRMFLYEDLQRAQRYVGNFSLVGATIMIPISLLLPLFSGLVGIGFSFLSFSGAGIHLATQSLYKKVKLAQEPAKREVPQYVFPEIKVAEVDNTEATDPPKPYSEWAGGPAVFSGILFGVAFFLDLSTVGASGGDLGAAFRSFAAFMFSLMQIGPTIYAASKKYRDFYVCLAFGVLTIVLLPLMGY